MEVKGNTTGQVQGLTLESVFIGHYMNALQNLQNIWLMKSQEQDLDVLKFNIQFEYLCRLIPDRVIQEEIQEEHKKLITEYKDQKLDYPEQRAALVVVTSIIEFICAAFELTHLDITGAATDDQANSDIRIPDKKEIPEDSIEVK